MRIRRLIIESNDKLAWKLEEPELISYAIEVAKLWLDRELKDKGRVTADLLNKACGILAEEIFAAALNQLNVPHIRTLPLLAKKHSVNYDKPFDVKIGSSTIDVKSIAPLPPPSGHHSNLNVNKSELEHYGKCDLYIASKCYPELPAEQRPKQISKEWAKAILNKIDRIDFIGYAEADELIKEANLQRSYGFYTLKPPFHSMQHDFALRFNIDLKQLKSASD